MAYLEWERFWSKVAPTNERGCRLWTGSTARFGHGTFWDGKKSEFAHRWAYESAVCPIPDNMCVIHKCDVPACVSPNHLMLGTRAENNSDKGAKRRGRGPLGERAWNSKLSEDSVRAIREAYAAGSASQCELGKRYGVSQVLVGRIVNRKTWKHTP